MFSLLLMRSQIEYPVYCGRTCCFRKLNSKPCKALGMALAVQSLCQVVNVSPPICERWKEFKLKTLPSSDIIAIIPKWHCALENNTQHATGAMKLVFHRRQQIQVWHWGINLSDLLFLQVCCKYQHLNAPILILAWTWCFFSAEHCFISLLRWNARLQLCLGTVLWNHIGAVML